MLPSEDYLNWLARIEDAITERLEPIKAEGAYVIARPEQMGRPMPQSQLLVAYRGSDFSEPKTVEEQLQERLTHWQVTWRVRDLQTQRQTYRIEQATLYLLRDWRPCLCERGLFPIKTTLEPQDEQGYWLCHLMFGLIVDAEVMPC